MQINNEKGNILSMVDSLKHSFTKSEKKIAEVFIGNPEDIIYCSITDFAEKVGVADSTIVRFCRKLGFKGYQDFKLSLAQELSSNQLELHTTLSDEIIINDSLDIVIQKIVNKNILALQETVALLQTDQVDKAVSLMQTSNRIVFYGVGSSHSTCIEAKNKFTRIGVPIEVYEDGHMQAMSASMLSDDDVAIAISYSGSTIDTVDTMEIAKKSGAKTICITHYAKSPITQHADIVLLSGYKEGPLQGGAITTKIAQLFVVDILYSEYFRRNMDIASKNKSKSAEAVSNKLY